MPGASGSKGSATGGTDAPIATGPGAKTPAMRQQEHADKKRQFEARRALTPGPGSYTPGQGIERQQQQEGKRSRICLVRRARRFASARRKWMRPVTRGSYDPYVLKELAVTSKKSASKAMKAGQGSFGTKHQRKLAIDIMGESTPGPGAYNGDVMMKNGMKANLSAMDTGEKMPSSAFKSKSAQREKSEDNKVPGAGAYSPSFTAIEKKPSNPANSMKAKASRFGKADTFERAQATEPGPGAYEIDEKIRSASGGAAEEQQEQPQEEDEDMTSARALQLAPM
ncbi:hypothetical protein Ctob_005141 [Chrysochromulina tobinii]|uniref:Uncharacterized protein n=1 Tax=Chrysochromulina tobinii TaxID=1460289 RepID=A0A0M0JF67_9EUKA|nr:hypothetical protein Ctob_005141 [Chrysochromulina tobinii]|eukprot:KOO24992.1 hypothetical protein Ctob_005141 [Chrysochromulina sp. CCMP291]